MKINARYAQRFLLALLLALCGVDTALAQAMYRIKPLGYLGGCTTLAPYGYDFNNADEVAGEACNANGDTHAFLWKNDGNPMIDLGPSEVGSRSGGVALSDSGLVGGWASDSTGNFAFTSLGDGTPAKRIYDGLGGTYIGANAINNLGQVTGTASTTNDNEIHAFAWKNDGSPMIDLGTLYSNFDYSEGNAINASGEVAGYILWQGAESHAFIWRNDGTAMVDLGTLGGLDSIAYYINASGQVAGYSNIPGPKYRKRARVFFWRNDGTSMQDVGTLGGAESLISGFNDSGQIAGRSDTHYFVKPHAFVWLNDGTSMKDLGTLGGTTSAASAINSSGQVTGYAYLAGDAVAHPFLWRNDGSKIQDLNNLIDPLDPLKPNVTLTGGTSNALHGGAFINDGGDILAQGTDSRTGMTGLYLLQGTVLALMPRSLAFGNQKVKISSAAKPITVTNTSAKAVTMTSITLTGSGAGQFASSNNCGKSLAGHGTCLIKVSFKPTAKGAKSATLNVNGGGGGLRSVSLTGMGI